MKFVCAFYHKSTTNKCWKCFPLKSYLPIWTGKCFKNLPWKKSLYPWQVCIRARSDARDRSVPLKKSSPDLNSYLKSYFPKERWLGKKSFANILALADIWRILVFVQCSNIQAQVCQTFYLGGQQLKSYLARIQTLSTLLNYFLDYRYKIIIKI